MTRRSRRLLKMISWFFPMMLESLCLTIIENVEYTI
nr:MAG TPA: hypothetical protein [Caudoviricetes sp.]